MSRGIPTRPGEVRPVGQSVGRANREILVDALVATKGGMVAVAAPRRVRARRLRFKHIDPDEARIGSMALAQLAHQEVARID